jgi:hypothetical protein
VGADQGGTEIGDSCKDVNAIAAAYESVVTTCRSRVWTWTSRAVRSQARRHRPAQQGHQVLQDWSRHWSHGAIHFVPTSASGLEASGLAVLRTRWRTAWIDVVNPMVFDYYDQ